MTTSTEKINSLKTIEFLNKEQAADLAKTALKEYTRRSKEGKAVDTAVYDMVLASGCPNRIRTAVESLIERYNK